MLKKLLHEWKTFALSVVGVLIGMHDAIVAAGYAPQDFAPIIPEQWRPYVTLAYPLGMLALRKWTDVNHQ